MTKEDTENALQAGADLIENVPELDDGLIQGASRKTRYGSVIFHFLRFLRF